MTAQKCLSCSQASSCLGKPPNFIKALRCQNKASASFPLQVPPHTITTNADTGLEPVSTHRAASKTSFPPSITQLLRLGCTLQGFVLLSTVATPVPQSLKQGEGCSSQQQAAAQGTHSTAHHSHLGSLQEKLRAFLACLNLFLLLFRGIQPS